MGHRLQRDLRPVRRLRPLALQLLGTQRADRHDFTADRDPNRRRRFRATLLWGPYGTLGRFLPPDYEIMFTAGAIILANIFVTFPLAFGVIKPVFDTMSRSLEEASATIGATRWQTSGTSRCLRCVARSCSGALLTFARAVGEFGSTILVSGNLAGRTQTAPLYIFAKFNEGQIEAANAIAIVLALFSFLIFSVLFFARDWLDVTEIQMVKAREKMVPQPVARDPRLPIRRRRLSVIGISKRFGKTSVLENISFDVAEGEVLVLLGASGSGKTTILRIIAGLEMPYAGKVVLHGKDVTDLPARERGVGIFQSYALFPKMTVEKNIGYGLRSKAEAQGDQRRSTSCSSWSNSKSIGKSILRNFPAASSSAWRLRELAYKPEVLLFDEPFGALDTQTRVHLRREIRALLRKYERAVDLHHARSGRRRSSSAIASRCSMRVTSNNWNAL